MKTDVLKELISLKIAVADQLIGQLPSPLQEKVVEIKQVLMKTVHEVSGEYLKTHASDTGQRTPDNGLKNVTID